MLKLDILALVTVDMWEMKIDLSHSFHFPTQSCLTLLSYIRYYFMLQ